MRQHQIVLLPGDGIGPEISSVTKELLKVAGQKHGFRLIFDEQLIGGSAFDLTGSPLPDKTLNACKESDAVLLAAIGDPKYDRYPREQRPESGLLGLRESLDLFANIRPVEIRPSLINSSCI